MNVPTLASIINKMAEVECNDPVLVRAETLTNPAAEYIECHLDAGSFLDVDPSTVPKLEYVPVLDEFQPQQEIVK